MGAFEWLDLGKPRDAPASDQPGLTGRMGERGSSYRFPPCTHVVDCWRTRWQNCLQLVPHFPPPKHRKIPDSVCRAIRYLLGYRAEMGA